MIIEAQRLRAFTTGGKGGNPAGVAILDAFPINSEMRFIAVEVGYSETVFAVARNSYWRVRYFAPAAEVNFCGHATIALGAALAERNSAGIYRLQLNEGEAVVAASPEGIARFESLLRYQGPWITLSTQLRTSRLM